MLINKQVSKTQTTRRTHYFSLVTNKKAFPELTPGKLLHKYAHDYCTTIFSI